MSKINNWFIESDVNYYVEDITAECGYSDGDGRGDGYGDGCGFDNGDGRGDGCGFADGDGIGSGIGGGRANIHGYGRE